MTLKQWKQKAAERFAGRFYITGGFRLIRHDTRTDTKGRPCCPLIAFSFSDEDMARFYDADNDCAEIAGVGLGLDPVAVSRIMSAADDSLECGIDSGAAELRQWMEAVLVHGKAVDA